MGATAADLASRLERTQWDFFWAPEGTIVVDRPELAYLASPLPLVSTNTAYRVRAAPDRLDALVAEVCAAHTGELSRFQVAETVDVTALESALDRGGYERGVVHIASVIDPRDHTPGASTGLRVERVTTTDGMADSESVLDQAFGGGMGGSTSSDRLAALLAQSVGEGCRLMRFVAYDGDRPISNGGLGLHPELDFALLWGGSTVAEARGRGAYRAIVSARLRAAAAAGISAVGLYARGDTSAPIIARLGFADVGRMHHWHRPEPVA